MSRPWDPYSCLRCFLWIQEHSKEKIPSPAPLVSIQLHKAIFVAIILDYFNDSTNDDNLALSYEDVEEFMRRWHEFDPWSSNFIGTNDLGLLLYSCDPPLVARPHRGENLPQNFCSPTEGESWPGGLYIRTLKSLATRLLTI